MPAKSTEAPAKAPRYVIKGAIVGPFRRGQVVTGEELARAGLDPAHLIAIGHAAPAAEE